MGVVATNPDMLDVVLLLQVAEGGYKGFTVIGDYLH